MIDKRETYYFSLVLALGAVLFLVFPFFFNSTVLTMGQLFIINPIYSIVACLLFTVKFGLRPYLPISLAILFIPAALLYYSWPELLYCFFYGAAALVGCTLGYPIHKRYQ